MSDAHSIYICTINCIRRIGVFKCIQRYIAVSNCPSTNFIVSDVMSIKSDGGTSRCRCPEAPSFGSCGQFESCWTPLAVVGHIQVGHPHPPLNSSISTAVCVWSAVDKGWTITATGNPEVARQTTGVVFMQLSVGMSWLVSCKYLHVNDMVVISNTTLQICAYNVCNYVYIYEDVSC